MIKIAKSLSYISTLKVLNIRDNQVTEEAADALSLAISNNTYMEYLWLGKNNLQAGVLKVFKALETLFNLKALDIDSNHIPESAYDELANIMQHSSVIRKLQTLYLDSSDLHLSGVKIAGALYHLTSLRVLNLSGASMIGEMADKLAVAIPNMALLQQLWLNNNNLGTEKVKTIAQSLSTLTTLIQLSLDGNQITEEAADAIASAIHANDSLEKLYLSDNDPRAGALTIVNALKNILTLKVLYLDNNSIPDLVFVELAKIFANMHLETLDLSNNCLQLSGKSISQALNNISTLNSLCLNNCFMTSESVNDLAAAIITKAMLNFVDLAQQFTTNEVISICQSLTCLSTLKDLRIGSKEVDGGAAEAIASVVMSNKNINWLILSSCKFQNDTIKVLRALQVVSSVTLLHLGYMNMSDDVATDLVLAIHNNPLLKELNLCGNLLSNSLIKIAQACKKNKYFIALDIHWNSVHPSAITELAQVTGTINTLEVLFMGGLSLKSNEKYINNLVLHLEKLCSDFHLINVTSAAKCQMMEVLNYELQRHRISSYIKTNYRIDYPSFSCADAIVISELLDSCLKSKPDVLAKSKQILSQVDAATIVYLLPVVSKLIWNRVILMKLLHLNWQLFLDATVFLSSYGLVGINLALLVPSLF